MLTVPLLFLVVGLTAAYESFHYPPVESYPIEEKIIRASCVEGHRRRFDYSQCAEYEECVDGAAGKWQKKKCFNEYAFNDFTGNCQRDEKCATVDSKKCPLSHVRLSCSELLVCAPKTGAYVRMSCEDGYRNVFDKGCIPDKRCSTKPETDECKPGDSRRTKNCRSFSLCHEGKWKRENCVDSKGRWKEYCSECDPEYKPRECKEGDSRPSNRTTPFDGYGIVPNQVIDCSNYELCDQGKWTAVACEVDKGYDPSAKRCTKARLENPVCRPPVAAPRCSDGTRVLIGDRKCRLFLQCTFGEWKSFICPEGSVIDEKGGCKVGKCEFEAEKNEPKVDEKKNKGDAEYKRGHHHDSDSYESSSEEDEREHHPGFYNQQPFEIPPMFPEPSRRLNGAPEPFPVLQSTLPHSRPGYLGVPQPQPVQPVQQQHNHQRPYHPHPAPVQPKPQPQPYPVAHPEPHYPVAHGPAYHPAPPVPVPVSYPSSRPAYPPASEPPRPPGWLCENDFKVADAFDAAFYYKCVNGYLKRVACPTNSRFDPQREKCLADYTWKPDLICYENQVVPTAYCGEYRICRSNSWLSGVCPFDQPFINGKCDKQRTCKAIVPPTPKPMPRTCAPGSVRPDYTTPNGYLECDCNYNWAKRSCGAGGVFDVRVSRCVYPTPTYPLPPTQAPYHPPTPPACYEGETRKDKKYCTKYEICHAGQFEERYCPYGYGFNGYHCEQGHTCGAPALTDGQCQESAGLRGFLPDRTDCAFFYQCAQGRWIRMPCAPGTHYSPTLGVCDHIGNVPGCGWTGPKPTHY